MIDKNGRCEMFLEEARRKEEQAFLKDYEEAKKNRGRYRTKTALAYFLVVLVIAVAAETFYAGKEIGTLVGVALASFGLIVRFSVRS